LPLLIEGLLAAGLVPGAFVAGSGGTVSERFHDVVVQRCPALTLMRGAWCRPRR
jgi:hypothetical protein